MVVSLIYERGSDALWSFFDFVCSQFDEIFEQINGIDTSADLPSTSKCNEHLDAPTLVDNSKDKELELQIHGSSRMNANSNAQQDDMGGMMKIVPPGEDVSIVVGRSFLRELFVSHISTF